MAHLDGARWLLCFALLQLDGLLRDLSAAESRRSEFDAAFACADEEEVVLQGDLQVHVLVGKRGEGLCVLGLELPDVQVVHAGHFFGDGGPPGGGGVAEAEDRDLSRATAGADEAFFLRLAEVDPVFGEAGEIELD
ncbi:MAG: hypothetical protein RIS79_947, partial [Verrucomicrobiota bacterium]